jgi:hypothetical protein
LGKKLLGGSYTIFHQTTLLGDAWKNTKKNFHLLENEKEKNEWRNIWQLLKLHSNLVEIFN